MNRERIIQVSSRIWELRSMLACAAKKTPEQRLEQFGTKGIPLIESGLKQLEEELDRLLGQA